MSMAEVIAIMRDKTKVADSKCLQWICYIRKEECLEQDKSCRECEVFIRYKEERQQHECKK